MSRFIQPREDGKKGKEPKRTPPPKPGKYTGDDLEKARNVPSPRGV